MYAMVYLKNYLDCCWCAEVSTETINWEANLLCAEEDKMVERLFGDDVKVLGAWFI